jgi:hypothetical protein
VRVVVERLETSQNGADLVCLANLLDFVTTVASIQSAAAAAAAAVGTSLSRIPTRTAAQSTSQL